MIVLAILLVANTILTNRQTAPASADIGRVLDLPGGDLQVREDGPADAPPLVLLHCFACSMRWWEPAIGDLARDHRVIRVDLLGHGRSEKPRDGYEMEHQADQVALALEELDVSEAIVAGHSMGGAVATALAERHPELVSGVSVIGTPPNEGFVDLPLTARLGFVPVLGQAIKRTVPDGMVRAGLESAFAEGTEVPDEFVEDFHRMTYSSYDGSSDASASFAEEEPLDRRLTEAGVPLLVIFGSEDGIVNPAAAEAYDVPGARVETIEGAGHSPNYERPDETTGLILDFAREHERAGGPRD